MGKNIIKLFFGLVLMMSLLTVSVFAFSDVDLESDKGKAIMKMYEHGYIQGDGNGKFRPDDTLTRAEFVTIINKMYDYTVDAENVFTDISEKDWFYKDVLAAVNVGYIKGMGDGRFSPYEKVTREQVCVMLERILNPELLPFEQKITDEVSVWAKESVEKLVSNRLFRLEDGGKFRALEPITRSETCVALEKCIVDTDIDIEPIDLDSIAREELEKKIPDLIKTMENDVIPALTYEKAIDVATRVTVSMKKFLEDENYDYIKDAQETYQIYRKSGEASKELKTVIFANIKIEDISLMLEFFYKPEISKVE